MPDDAADETLAETLSDGTRVTVPAVRRLAHLLIRSYQLTASALVGRQCRHLPTCSDYADEAIARHGLWAGGWMGAARICRCRPFGTHGFDPVPAAVPATAAWFCPWRYGRWSGPLAAEAAGEDDVGVNDPLRERSARRS